MAQTANGSGMAGMRDRDGVLSASYRDPSGFVFRRDGWLYRQVNRCYTDHYDRLHASGLYDALTTEGLLIPHQEVDIPAEVPETAYKIIAPDTLRFVSYPYEWCFSQLKDAALLTLRVQEIALAHGMTLKDSSAFNVQFRWGKPMFIDTLSFEIYHEGDVWIPYRQFCEHFLAPLGLMLFSDIRLSKLMRLNLDGIPLDLASTLLPFATRFKLPWYLHIHLHARFQQRHAATSLHGKNRRMSKMQLMALLDSLAGAVRALKWEPRGTEWADYYTDTNYTEDGFQQKRQIVADFLDAVKPTTAWDLGANNGLFSRLASEHDIFTVAFDSDPAAVEQNYRICRERNDPHLLPLLIDLTNPTPSVGWANRERMSLIERGPVDAVLALALIHHLAISHNVPLPKVAELFSRIGRTLIIEFVPKHDSQVQRLLASREDIFEDYTQEAFERAFSRYFRLRQQQSIRDSARVLYLMESVTA